MILSILSLFSILIRDDVVIFFSMMNWWCLLYLKIWLVNYLATISVCASELSLYCFFFFFDSIAYAVCPATVYIPKRYYFSLRVHCSVSKSFCKVSIQYKLIILLPTNFFFCCLYVDEYKFSFFIFCWLVIFWDL